MAAEEKCIYPGHEGPLILSELPAEDRQKETGVAQSISISESIRKGTGNINVLWFSIAYLFDQIGILA